MEINTQAIFDKIQNPTARGPRDELIVKFMERINPGRERAGFEPYTYPAMATRLLRLRRMR